MPNTQKAMVLPFITSKVSHSPMPSCLSLWRCCLLFYGRLLPENKVSISYSIEIDKYLRVHYHFWVRIFGKVDKTDKLSIMAMRYLINCMINCLGDCSWQPMLLQIAANVFLKKSTTAL